MKTRFFSRSTGLLLTTGLSLMAGRCVRASEGTSIASVKLSSPDKPATLRIDMPWADIHIAGVDTDTVTVESSLAKNAVAPNRNDGLRRLDDAVNFDLNEHENQVRLTVAGENSRAAHNEDFNISVPRTIALTIKTETGGDLDIKDVTGDIEVNAINGEVRLEGLAGSVVVNTINGEVRATYAQSPQKLVSITSMNGAVSLRVPVETKANIRLRNQNGAIFTDFDKTTLKTKSENRDRIDGKDRPDGVRAGSDVASAAFESHRRIALPADSGHTALSADPDIPSLPPLPITGGKLVRGTLNGGGVDIKISTMNGEITLRRTDSATHAPPPNPPPRERITVVFQDPDNFTDIRASHSGMNSTSDLDEIRDFVRKTAEPRLAAGTTLAVTFLDLDFAGEIRPDQYNIRVMTAATTPRAHLKYELLGANGEVIKEGERRLSDMNYQQSVLPTGRNDPLSYEKQLLRDWITREFISKS